MEIIKLDKSISKAKFDCGNNELNTYIKQYASQDQKKFIANCYCLVDENQTLLAYYTISAASMPIDKFPAAIKGKLPKYKSIGCILIGRLAVDIKHRGRNFGAHLLIDAMKKSFNSQAAVHSIIVDAKNDKAIKFYEKFGFTKFVDLQNKLFITRPSDWK